MFKLCTKKLKKLPEKKMKAVGTVWGKERASKKLKGRQCGSWGKMRLEKKSEPELAGLYTPC